MMERLECKYNDGFEKPKNTTHAEYLQQKLDKYYPLNSRLGHISFDGPVSGI